MTSHIFPLFSAMYRCIVLNYQVTSKAEQYEPWQIQAFKKITIRERNRTRS